MKVLKFDESSVIGRVHMAIRDAQEKGHVVYEVELTPEEYAQAKVELKLRPEVGELSVLPPTGVYFTVDGVNPGDAEAEKAAKRRELH